MLFNLLMNALFVIGDSFETQDSKDIYRCKGGGEDCYATHEEGVPPAIVFHRIIRGEGNQRPEGQTQRVQHLARCVHPDIWVQQFRHLQYNNYFLRYTFS